MAAHAPGVTVIDITHRIAPHDVRAGALTLWRSVPWLVPGVILAVVDPGVGTARRGVAIEVAAADAVLVGPDNGLLLPAALLLGPITTAVELRAPDLETAGPWLPAPGGPERRGVTFAGRDLFAPICAALAQGADLGGLGQAIDPAGLVGEPVPSPATGDADRVGSTVLWVDRFGNAELNVRPGDLTDLGPVVELRVKEQTWPARLAASYADVGPGPAVGLVTDSYGFLSISCDRSSAADLMGLHVGDEIWISRPPVI
jgi:S-adenosylmethionine hydrolase